MKIQGFTLIEVMMATAIIAVGFIGLTQGVAIGSGVLDTARKQQVAAQLISAEIERLRVGSWSTIANLPSSGTIAIGTNGAITGDETCFALSNYTGSNSDDNAALSNLAKGFSCSFVRTRLRPTAATASTATFVKVVYTVTWKGNTGRIFSRTTQTYLGKSGLQLSYQRS